ncbi:Bifunctional inhibitor/plant lipid transfer protein/seed storage helical domain [Dillenia turbinata]|uniref:Non-specific lipid-transfer protein n=1 Tax=Dillenia turbinata TaxID=194707 RepID=A0AAN8ZFM2_9MAGN
MEKKTMLPTWILCLALFMLLAKPTWGIDCGEAVSSLVSCESYLFGSGDPKPSAACCSSAQALNKKVNTKPERKSLCECFKKMAPSLGVNNKRVEQLPTFCKLNLNLAITPDVDCNNHEVRETVKYHSTAMP